MNIIHVNIATAGLVKDSCCAHVEAQQLHF